MEKPDFKLQNSERLTDEELKQLMAEEMAKLKAAGELIHKIYHQVCPLCHQANIAEDKVFNVVLGECHLSCMVLEILGENPESRIQNPEGQAGLGTNQAEPGPNGGKP